ncbi:hypothetical protein [Aestuariibaculum marinum]|uniref:Uncharacterized protein n=1 Tax=Aestuariibaculum marinum TaxID=2683592 RepID=A0A8J6U9X4_9FLAO|nr:hypothetical protein [Aestuariibaculum marinum]MBD0822628.1 hypothetical protein [Aestuariibaculum marinum]
MKSMNLTQKVLCCHGYLTAKSTAVVCGCTPSQVYNIWNQNNKKSIKKNKHRAAPAWT